MLHLIKSKIKSNPFTAFLLRAIGATGCPSVVILRYHSIKEKAAPYPDYLAGIIHDDHTFAAHMRIISREFDPVSMGDILDMANGRIKIPRRGVAVTFDDGFADNCEIAMPIMDHYGIKGCIYVTVGHVETGNPVWFMRLRRAFGATTLSEYRGMDGVAYRLDNPTQRRAAFLESSSLLARLVGEKQIFAVSKIEETLEVAPFDTNCRVILSWDHMQQLLKRGHTIGCHTMSHANVAHIDNAELDCECLESRKVLEHNLGIAIEHFAYPKPILRPYFSDLTQGVLIRSGYRTIATCEPGAYTGGSPFQLPRIVVPDSVGEFEWALGLTRISSRAVRRNNVNG